MGSNSSEVNSLYIIGDLHGQIDKTVRLLRNANLLDEQTTWTGGSATLWFLGDFFDRGPDGIACVDLVMRLQREADDAGGAVRALLGNHEPLLLAAQRFGQRSTGHMSTMFVMNWLHNGGLLQDMERLTAAHVEWLTALPAMARVGDRLLVHADSWIYPTYGHTIDEVNRAISAILRGDDACAWDALLHRFTQRSIFTDAVPANAQPASLPVGASGADRAREFLRIFGGRQLIHGHTPIHYVTGKPSAAITEPLIYADGLCVNVDGGLYLGGPGFLYAPPPPE
jgi:hypothetical protein